MLYLWPPIASLRRDLFGPSDTLLRQWIESPASIASDTRQWLQGNPVALEMRATYMHTRHAPAEDEGAVDNAEMPESLREILARRKKAMGNIKSEPAAGLIIQINRIPATSHSPPRELAAPVAVLLSEPAADGGTWRGWMVSSETDYASYWDLIPATDPNRIHDPLAGMVQLWNPVMVTPEAPFPVLMELDSREMAAIRLAARQFTEGYRPEVAPDPGERIRRDLGGIVFESGTPLGGKEDPRVQYQELYGLVAEQLTAAATSRVIPDTTRNN